MMDKKINLELLWSRSILENIKKSIHRVTGYLVHQRL